MFFFLSPLIRDCPCKSCRCPWRTVSIREAWRLNDDDKSWSIYLWYHTDLDHASPTNNKSFVSRKLVIHVFCQEMHVLLQTDLFLPLDISGQHQTTCYQYYGVLQSYEEGSWKQKWRPLLLSCLFWVELKMVESANVKSLTLKQMLKKVFSCDSFIDN